MAIGARDADYLGRLRDTVLRHGMFIEGSVMAPRSQADVDEFDAQVRSAKLAGATVVRTVMLSGRRYETFKSIEEFDAFRQRSIRTLELAEPVLARHKTRLAVENHKDFRAGGLLQLIRGISSEFVGVCVDTGNNIALLEHPNETAEQLAPWVTSCHLKDMAVSEYRDGFLLAEVPLGQGFLDLKHIVGLLRGARPELNFSLEMITRDPLKIPVLTDQYWETFEALPARTLVRTLALVRDKGTENGLPILSQLSDEEKLQAEERNVRQSLEYAASELGLM